MRFAISNGPSQLTWRRPPFDKLRAGSRLSRRGEGGWLGRWLFSISILCGLWLSSTALSSAADWTVHAQPAALVNGAPVLFQVKPPAKLESLTGTWRTHQLTFSYQASTKTWFVLAGVPFETEPGKYPLELTGERAGTKTPLNFTRTFAVARAHYPQIKVELTVEKKFTEPIPRAGSANR